MGASRSTTAALLTNYAIDHHCFNYYRHTVAEVKRSLAFYARYHMHIRRMCLPGEWNEPLVDSATGLPHLPRSLLKFMSGQNIWDLATARAKMGASIIAALTGRAVSAAAAAWRATYQPAEVEVRT